MYIIHRAAHFLVGYDWAVMAFVFLGGWIFFAANAVRDPYRAQNKSLRRCACRALAEPRLTAAFAHALPEQYARQWRAFERGGAERPSLTFEFVPMRRKVVFLHLFVACAAVSAAYVPLYFYVHKGHYLVFQGVVWLQFALTIAVGKSLFVRKEARARRIFGTFVAQLNALHKGGADVLRQLDCMRKNLCPDTLSKVSELLRKNGLRGRRTAEEQRKINDALNRLLQSYCRTSAGKG